MLTKLFWWLESIVVALTSLGLPKWTSWLFVFFSLGAATTLLWHRRQRFCFPTELALLGSAAMLHYFINALILYTFRGWYLITEILAFSALLSFLVRYDKGGIRLLRLFWLGFYGGLYFFTLGWMGMWRLSPQANAVIWEAYEVAKWLRSYTQPNDRCASWDAGVIGYFSHRKVINLDGLVNDFQFLTLSYKDLPRYLLENEVKYLTTYFPGGDWTAYWRFRADTATWARLLREPVYSRHFYHQMPGIFEEHASGAYAYYIWRIDSN